ncbi:hypothetical protein HUT06_36925 [Actinomadura sp. NAK00032]|uniref:hypothetical protein n=1 Tax=Actinomadura sp. NAK00032 TaxID=2742128 RepID=UPI00158FC00E|nr:hypothetical protein [Actinomadura sp. NAK00032]QKW38926.1 hypothetical protein HUT06_36925 [Actinomadura sp. NAK00032]
MRVTHGRASESGGLAGPFWTPPTRRELDASAASEGTVLSSAVQRVRDELDDPRPVRAGFDNRLAPVAADGAKH